MEAGTEIIDLTDVDPGPLGLGCDPELIEAWLAGHLGKPQTPGRLERKVAQLAPGEIHG